MVLGLGTALAVATSERMQPGLPADILRGHAMPVNTVVFAPNGQTLATGAGWHNGSGEVQLWDTTSGCASLCLAGLTRAVRASATRTRA